MFLLEKNIACRRLKQNNLCRNIFLFSQRCKIFCIGCKIIPQVFLLIATSFKSVMKCSYSRRGRVRLPLFTSDIAGNIKYQYHVHLDLVKHHHQHNRLKPRLINIGMFNMKPISYTINIAISSNIIKYFTFGLHSPLQ